MRAPFGTQSAAGDAVLIRSEGMLPWGQGLCCTHKRTGFLHGIRIYLRGGHTFKCGITSAACLMVHKALTGHGVRECPQRGTNHTRTHECDWGALRSQHMLPKARLTCISLDVGNSKVRNAFFSIRTRAAWSRFKNMAQSCNTIWISILSLNNMWEEGKSFHPKGIEACNFYCFLYTFAHIISNKHMYFKSQERFF